MREQQSPESAGYYDDLEWDRVSEWFKDQEYDPAQEQLRGSETRPFPPDVDFESDLDYVYSPYDEHNYTPRFDVAFDLARLDVPCYA